MFTLDTIFISLTLLILSAVLIKLKVSKAIIPLTIIYVFFIFNKLSTSKVENHSKVDDENNKIEFIQPQKSFETDETIGNNQGKKFVIKDASTNQKKTEEQRQIDEGSINTKEEKKLKQKEVSAKIKKNAQKKVLQEIEKKQAFNNLIKLKEIKICKNIKNRSPIGVGEIFPSSVDSLYCFTKIENLGKKMEVRHVWYYENQIMTQVRYNVKKSNVYRSWTKKTISSFQIGNWRVEVQDRNGTIIGTKRFKIKKSS